VVSVWVSAVHVVAVEVYSFVGIIGYVVVCYVVCCAAACYVYAVVVGVCVAIFYCVVGAAS